MVAPARREGGRQKKTYVRSADLPVVLLAAEAQRAAKVTAATAKAVRRQVKAK